MDPIVNDLLARAQKAGAGRAAFRFFVKTDYVLQVVYASILAAGGLVALVVAIFTINDFAVALALILLPGAYIVWLVAKGMRGASRES